MHPDACLEPGNPDMETLKTELFKIINKRLLSAVFQPIVNIRMRNIHGYQSLIRGPSNSLLHSPSTLFDVAEKSGTLFNLEMLAREIASHAFSKLNLPGKIFLNVSSAVLLQPGYEAGVTKDFLKNSVFLRKMWLLN